MTPRITLVVLAYRQAAFIDAACASALAQEGEPIEIMLSDDASPDTTFEQMSAIAAAYRGPHDVRARRNERNLGMGEHLNEVVRAARGRLIVLMAGDDISLPDRVARVAAAWDAHGEAADLIASHVIDMSDDGRDLGTLRVDDLATWRGPADWALQRPYIVGAAHAVTRRLFDRFGPLAHDVAHEDQVNLLRALCSGGAITVDAALVRYRRGGVSDRNTAPSAEAFNARLRRQTAKHLALHAQWLADARTAGCEALVEHATRRELGRERFLHDLLAQPDAAGQWRALRSHPAVSLGWRLGRYAHQRWPGLAERLRGWQAASRRWRHGETR